MELDSCFIKHKYTEPVEVAMRLMPMMVGGEALVRVEMKRLGPAEELVMVDRKGRVK